VTGTPSATGTARPRFAARLLVAQALVLVAGALTTWLVASVVGPNIFSDHLKRAGDTHTAEGTRHVEEAFAAALLISVALALVASILAALAVSWYFSRRVQRSIAAVADAASQIAAGRYDARVPDPGLGGEFAILALTYNRIAERLEATESTRRSMLADLAHEMPTPLATIDAHLEAVEDGVRTLDDDTLEVIRGSTGRLRRLAEDMAAVSRAEEEGLDIALRTMAAAEVAATAVAVAGDRYAAKGVHLAVDLAEAGQVRVDPDRIGQVLGNLLDNALRHTPLVAPRPWAVAASAAGSSTSWPTPAKALRPSTSRTCSTGSTGPTLPGIETMGARVSASRSPRRWSKHTAVAFR
jgi:signal transduction histidine kinase